MSRTNHPKPDHDAGNNLGDMATQSKASTAPATEPSQGGNVEISWHFMEEKTRELEPNLTLVATIKSLFEEQYNKMTNHIARHIFDVIKSMVINAINNVILGLGHLISSY